MQDFRKHRAAIVTGFEFAFSCLELLSNITILCKTSFKFEPFKVWMSWSGGYNCSCLQVPLHRNITHDNPDINDEHNTIKSLLFDCRERPRLMFHQTYLGLQLRHHALIMRCRINDRHSFVLETPNHILLDSEKVVKLHVSKCFDCRVDSYMSECRYFFKASLIKNMELCSADVDQTCLCKWTLYALSTVLWKGHRTSIDCFQPGRMCHPSPTFFTSSFSHHDRLPCKTQNITCNEYIHLR